MNTYVVWLHMVGIINNWNLKIYSEETSVAKELVLINNSIITTKDKKIISN